MAPPRFLRIPLFFTNFYGFLPMAPPRFLRIPLHKAPPQFMKTQFFFRRLYNFLHMAPEIFKKAITYSENYISFSYVGPQGILYLRSGAPKKEFLGPPLLVHISDLYATEILTTR